MIVSLRVIGLKPFRDAMDRASRRIRPAAEKNLRRAAEILVGVAKRQFEGSRTRSLYAIRRGRRVKRKTPLPITAPPHRLAVFEGHYRRSITYDVHRRMWTTWAEVGPVHVPYARVHEFGLRGMPKRPVLTPAVDQTRERIFRLLGVALREIR